MSAGAGTRNEWVIRRKTGEYMAGVQAFAGHMRNVDYLVAETDSYHTAARFCTKGKARMMAALLNSHEWDKMRQWVVIRLGASA